MSWLQNRLVASRIVVSFTLNSQLLSNGPAYCRETTTSKARAVITFRPDAYPCVS